MSDGSCAPCRVAALLLIVLAFGLPIFAQESPDLSTVPVVDTVKKAEGARFAFSVSGTTARRWGFTEYEIDVGRVLLLPARKLVSAGSRLRFPSNPWLFGLTAAVELNGFRFAPTLWLSHTNALDLFKDFDWYELDGRQSSFIYGTATNDDALIGVDANLSFRVQTGKFSFRPQLQFTFLRMKFDEESLDQTDYGGIDIQDDIAVLVYYPEPINTKISGAVLRYRVDYKIVYGGGSFGYWSPSGFGAELTALFTPACWGSDFDEHLLRDKESRSSTDGAAGHIDLAVVYEFSRDIGLSGNVSYDFINTSGTQTQTMLDTGTKQILTFVGIPVRTKAEWLSIGLTLGVRFGS